MCRIIVWRKFGFLPRSGFVQPGSREGRPQAALVVPYAALRPPLTSTLELFIKGVFMPHVLIIHEVESYPAGKVVFDQAADIRKRSGEINYQLLRYDNDANNIVHFSKWSSLDNARRFFESPELVKIRKKAGVKSPDFIYLQEIEHGVL